jgi:amidase
MGEEPVIPSVAFHLKTFGIEELTIKELFALNTKQAVYKAQMAEFWRSTASETSNKLPIDAIICPVHPSSGYPHDFPSWWGWTSLFNILDYPSTTIPIKHLKISSTADPVDATYKPLDNPFDKPTYDICKLSMPLRGDCQTVE